MIGTMGVLQNGGGGGKSSPCGRGDQKLSFQGALTFLPHLEMVGRGEGEGAQQVSDR